MFGFESFGGYSPLLSLVTAAFEIGVGAWALRGMNAGHGRRSVVLPTAVLLFVLAGYQLLEIFVCGMPGNSLWARLAFADVVWLPPLGMWVVAVASGAADGIWGRLVKLSFWGAGGLTAWILTDPTFVTGSVCDAVFATYEHGSQWYSLYGGFYQLGLFGIIFGGGFAMVNSDDRLARAHAGDMQMGTLGFVVPALLTEVLVPALNTSMPSVMCHYALVLGLFLARMLVRERRCSGDVVAGSGRAEVSVA